MKNKTIYVAMLTTLGLMATGCQKEMVENLPNQTSVSISAYTVEYSINGETFRTVLQSEEEYDALLLRLVALAREGYTVQVRNGNTIRQGNASKEVVTYTTTDSDDAKRWTKKMMNEGYEVTITFDEETGIYTCIAIK